MPPVRDSVSTAWKMVRSFLAHLIRNLRAAFGAAGGQDGGLIFETRIGAAPENAREKLVRAVAQLDPPGVSAAVEVVFGMGELAEEERLQAEIENGVAAVEAVVIARIFVAGESAADLQAIGDFHLRVAAVNPEAIAALIDFVGDADGDRD